MNLAAAAQGSELVIFALVLEPPNKDGWDFDLPEFFNLNDDGEELEAVIDLWDMELGRA